MEIPKNELEISFARSSGAGGQNVNKVETKVVAHWDFENSSILNEQNKKNIRKKLEHIINKEGQIYLSNESTREQVRNKELVIGQLHRLVFGALEEDKIRIPTSAPKNENEKRLEDKHIQSRKKQSRKVDLNE